MQYQIIKAQEELNDFVNKIKTSPVLAVDTEFMRRRTLFPEIALIQVYDGKHLALIDPLIDLDFTCFWLLLKDTNIIKVFHSPSEDIEVFQNFAGFVPFPMFDTQFALHILGKGNCVGFAKMVKQYLDIDIDKSESRTDWLQRPLTQKQLDYAASDVFYLKPCFDEIVSDINNAGLFEIVVEESCLIARKRAFEIPNEYAFTDIKNAWQLKPKDLALLKILTLWRRNKARKKNLALNLVLKESNMVEIVRRRPKSLSSLRSVPGVELIEVSRSGKEIIQCIIESETIAEKQFPEKVLRLIDYPQYKKTLKELQATIVNIAQTASIPPDVFASKKQINQLLSWNWKMTAEQRAVYLKPDLLQDWRYSFTKGVLAEWDPSV